MKVNAVIATGTINDLLSQCRYEDARDAGVFIQVSPALMGRPARDARAERLERGTHSLARSIDGHIRLRVQLIPAGENPPQVIHGLAIARHGSHVTLSDDASHMLFRRGFDPNSETGGEQVTISLCL